MPKGKIRHMFPGGNTSEGFFSYYKYIISQEDARRIFVLKGGPGVGKSTFMKNAGMAMVDWGYDVEFMHCSSDNNSLDGLVIPRIGVAMIDGTAPHVVDPKNPGVVDEIIHLGDFWNEAAMRKGRQKVLKINSEIGAIFERAYRYLRAAAHIYEDTAVLYSSNIDEAKINKAADELKEEVFGGIPLAEVTGRERRLFASAITPDGLKNYLDDLIVLENVYTLEGFPGSGSERILEGLKLEALIRGFSVEAYYCAFHPKKLEHLIIPALDTAFTTVNKYHSTDACITKKIELSGMLDLEILAEKNELLDFDRMMFEKLLDRAIQTIGGAKALHDEMETYYIPYMDFNKVKVCWDATMERILGYAGEK